MNVYLLQHARQSDEADTVKIIGIYRTRFDAEDARTRATTLPGFRGHQDGFSIDLYELGADYWTSGYATMQDGNETAEEVT